MCRHLIADAFLLLLLRRYLAQFRETHNTLLWADGPLPLDYRQMIAIIAAGRHQCTYLVCTMAQRETLVPHCCSPFSLCVV